jgi:hypothetical protein
MDIEVSDTVEVRFSAVTTISSIPDFLVSSSSALKPMEEKEIRKDINATFSNFIFM